jgi:hypothetical protein
MDYIITDDKKKSEHLLLPLLDLAKTHGGLLVKPDKVFCYWEPVCGINCLEIGLFFKETKSNFWEGFEVSLLKNKNLMSSYFVEGGSVYIFTVDQYYEDVDKFLKGKYSQFHKDTKQKIRSYYCNFAVQGDPTPKNDYYKIVLHPDRYFAKAAEELGVEEKYLEKQGELMSKPTIEDETANYKLIQ